MGELSIGVLGPLRVEVDGTAVRLGPRLVALLSVLVMEAGRSVSARRLTDLLWAGKAPKGAAATLRSHVSHLRRALGQDAATPGGVVTVGSGAGVGYRLDVAPERVDACRFERAGAEWRQALAAGRPDRTERAAALAADALALWRGPAYADVADLPFAIPEVARLEALRRAARVGHAEALCALGRYTEVTGDLLRLVEEEPHDEALRRLLALALYGDNRVAEAAQVCRDGLELLADRGIEAPHLRDLQRTILRREATVVAAPVAAVRRPAPCLLPPDPPQFVGRAEELAQVCRLLADPAGKRSPLVVTGPGGVGKTTLVVRLGHAVADQFPDGQLYADLKGFDPGGLATPSAEVVRVFLEALDVPAHEVPATEPAQAAMYRRLLADRRVLVVLDNARDAAQVRPLLPGAAGCAVVVTSRNELPSLITADGARPVRLGLLPTRDAHELLRRRVGRDRLAAEPAAADAIVTACAGLPLALAIVAARAATNPGFALRVVAQELRDTDSLDAFTTGDADTDVRSVFATSYRTLDDATGRVFRLLGAHPGPDIAVPATAHLVGLPERAAHRQLTALARAHLATEHTPGRYAMHDLLRTYATELSGMGVAPERGPSREADDALTRVMTYYLATTREATRLAYPGRTHHPVPDVGLVSTPFRSPDAARGWLAAERRNLVAGVRRSLRGRPEHARLGVGLALAMHWFLVLSYHPHDNLTVYEEVIPAAARLGDRRAEAAARGSLSHTLMNTGRAAEACHHLSSELSICRELGDRFGEQRALGNLGSALSISGRAEEATGCYRQQLAIAQEIGAPVGEAYARIGLGKAYGQLGHPERAIAQLQQALAWCDRTGDHYLGSEALKELGRIHIDLGRLREAVHLLDRGRERAQRTGHRSGEATNLIRLARAWRLLGTPDKAVSYARQAAALSADFGDTRTNREVRTEYATILATRPQSQPTPPTDRMFPEHAVPHRMFGEHAVF